MEMEAPFDGLLPLVNVLGVATYLINVITGAYLITLNWIDAYKK